MALQQAQGGRAEGEHVVWYSSVKCKLKTTGKVERHFSPALGLTKHNHKPGDSSHWSEGHIFLQKLLRGLLVWGETVAVISSTSCHADVIATHTMQATGNFKLPAINTFHLPVF